MPSRPAKKVAQARGVASALRSDQERTGGLTPPHAPVVFFSQVFLAWLIALFVARWLMPTEGAAEGLTLWIVQLVLFTAVGRAAWMWRVGERSVRFDVIDGVIGLLVGGPVVSALAVAFTVGNQRGAINLAWEWIGTGVLIWLIRQELKSARVVREVCLGLSLTVAVLAGYGMYQHYIGYPQMVREYDRLISEVTELTAPKEAGQERLRSSSEERRLMQLQNEMSWQGIPLEASARVMWDNRLKASSEPIGLFALANSFAGLLVVMLLLAFGCVASGQGIPDADQIQARRASEGMSPQTPRLRVGLVSDVVQSIARPWGLWAVVGVIGFCLVLTKSRTAFCGLIAGACWWGGRWLMQRRSEQISKLAIGRWMLIGAVIVGVGITAAALSGGLDFAVLSQAPKSLRYRLEYWQGTWATIREHLWLGTGPANFRDYYFRHKLPESSEEIADPHNFILDVWANAGLLGLFGLLACVALMVRSWTQRLREDDGQTVEGESGESSDCRWTSPAVWGAGIAFPVAAIGMELLGHGADERLWWLGGIWWSMWLCVVVWERRFSEMQPNASVNAFGLARALEAANVALLVHLLGAGGIAMPAITQLLLLVWVSRSAMSAAGKEKDHERETSSSESGASGVKSEPVWLAITGGAVFLSGLCWMSGTMPELTCRTALDLGDNSWLERRNFDASSAHYADAAVADRFALEPLERQAELSTQRAHQSQRAVDIDAAARHWQLIVDRLPFSPRPYRRLGEFWLTRFEQTRDPQDAQRAAEALGSAVKRYPHHAVLLSQWAAASQGSGQFTAAQEAARRALRQDDLNRCAGHIDKYLDAATRGRMERLQSAAPPDAGAN